MVTDDYARAYEAGALAALDYITDGRPELEDWALLAAIKIGRDLDVMLGRSDG